MRVLRLEAENVKRIRAVDITPDDAMVLVTGRNEQGKSSVLDCLWWALAGAKHIQAVPIHQGENKARIRLELGNGTTELVVERRFTAASSYLHVENADGSPFASPQMLLDKLLGALTFDPLEFTRMKPVDQFDQLRRAVRLQFDFAAADTAHTDEFNRRTELNRKVKDREAQARGIMLPDGLPEEPVDEQALLDVIQQGDTSNAALTLERGRRTRLAEDSANHRAKAAEAEEDVALARAQIEALQQKIGLHEAKKQAALSAAMAAELTIASLGPLPEPIDTSDTRKRLDAAQATNTWLRERGRRKQLEDQAAALQKESDALTTSMEARKQLRADAIAAAAMPVDGLSLGENCVMYQGLPFTQASLAVQIKVSLAVAMAAQSPLRVVRIREGSALDSASMQVIRDLAVQNDFQVWVEAMREDGRTGIVIEDGAVLSTPASRAAADVTAEASRASGHHPV